MNKVYESEILDPEETEAPTIQAETMEEEEVEDNIAHKQQQEQQQEQPEPMRRSTRAKKKVQWYEPTFKGQKYEYSNQMDADDNYANVQIGETLEYDEAYACVIVRVLQSKMFQHYSLKAAMKKWGKDHVMAAGTKEMKQLHD